MFESHINENKPRVAPIKKPRLGIGIQAILGIETDRLETTSADIPTASALVSIASCRTLVLTDKS